MNRRTVLALVGTASGSLAGCLSTLSSEGGESSGGLASDVAHTPDGVTAQYDYIEYAPEETAPALDGDYDVFDDTNVAEDALGEDDELPSLIRSAPETTDSYVVSTNQTEGDVETVSVDSIKETVDGLQFDVVFEKDHVHGADVSTEAVVIAVESVDSIAIETVEWFEPVECSAAYVPRHRLPNPVEREVDIALEDGAYETVGTLLYSLATDPDATLWTGEAYYESSVTEEGETTTLQFDQTTASAGEPARLSIVNGRAEVVQVAVTVSRDGEAFVEEAHKIDQTEHAELETVNPDDKSVTTVEIAAEFGRYELSVETDDGDAIDETVTVDPEHHDWVLGLFDGDGRYDAVELESAFDLEDAAISKPIGLCIDTGGWWGYSGE